MKFDRAFPSIDCALIIHLYGLRRSGNHAIINWLIPMADGLACHINDAQLPYRIYNSKNIMLKQQDVDPGKINVTIINYENRNLAKFDPPKFKICADKVEHILLLRDPYNTAASLLKNQYVLEHSNFRVPMYNIAQQWIQYAKEYFGLTQHLPESTIKIGFRQWLTDAEFRKSIADHLGLEYNDEGLNKLSDYGGGSSFDGMNYDGRTQEMDLFNRCKEFAENPRYIKMVNNRNMHKLYKRILEASDNGDIPRP